MRDRIQQQIDLAKINGDALLVGVQEWMNKADIEISKVEEFVEEETQAKKTCFNLRPCVNFSTLYHYRLVDLYQRKNLDDIDTHKLALGKIIEAIKDESIQMVGIYGSGGVGKTTLANEAAAEVKNLFAEIVFITVSHNVDVKNIQKNVEKSAKRIINGEKILIILDDIWKKLVFHVGMAT
ncbi:unnamed protein product [Lactuca saligna]|uniref:NB-ARC domain-containing protein n=1 Tax=Lactuca saligna TaxID=75948 RepID=A0AA35VQX7_LACSI|nr:unnamed protein product [Lactuca saligna]